MNELTIYKTLPKNFSPQVAIATSWIKYGNEFLFVQRSPKSKNPLVWAVPGGKIEIGETPIQGMVRETQEETSISLKEDVVKDLGFFYIKTPQYQYTYHMFFVELNEKPPVKMSQEHNDFKWIILSECQLIPLMLGVKETIDIFQHKLKKLSLS